MKKNLWLLGLLIFIFASCHPATKPGTSGPKEIWFDITILESAHGTWVASQNQTMPLEDAFEMIALLGIDAFDPAILDGIESFIKDINVDIAAEMTMIIDAVPQTMSNAVKATLTFSGGSTPILWMLMQMYIPPEKIPPNVSFDDKNHAITVDVENPPALITEEDRARFQINQTGAKLKATTAYAGYEEIIFTRVN